MPIYVYACENEDCDQERFERTLDMSKRGSVCCPKCDGNVRIVPQRTTWGFAAWANPHHDRPSRADVMQPSGLMQNGARNGW